MKNQQNNLLNTLRKQLKGLCRKVFDDFGQESYELELQDLKKDSVYPKFSFDRPEYVLIRLMGRLSISVGRRLGEIYDKIPRILASSHYNLDPSDVAPKLDGLELDVGLRFSLISEEQQKLIKETVKLYTQTSVDEQKGVGIEIRYNFNPNDSSRLRKDVKMAELLKNEGLVPIYLVFSSISPREDAIARLTRAGWYFLIGENAIAFLKDILGEDFLNLLENPDIKNEIVKEIDQIMKSLVNSYAFREVLREHDLSLPGVNDGLK